MTATHAARLLSLDDPGADDPSLVGAKAANLAAARRAGLPALPGEVLTVQWPADDVASALAAWRRASQDGTRAVVVRSSSAGEDGAESSMAGVFVSVLGVADEDSFLLAVARVLGSADKARDAGLVDAPIAVLVQPMLEPQWGGVLFGADPVTGRRDRLVVAAVPSGPDALVSGTVDGWTALLGLRGRVREVRTPPETDSPAPPPAILRSLAKLAARAEETYGGPQDLEWAVDGGDVVLLQARPITALPSRHGAVFGPGPVAESFPEPLSALEEDLWVAPLRDGLREALLLAGTSTSAELERTGLVVTVGGMVAVDLGAIGVDDTPGGLLRRLDPRPPARRLRAAWRVGRLRRALPGLAGDVVARIDDDLLAVPSVGELSDEQLLAVLRNARGHLAAAHGYEALAGLLIPGSDVATVTGASLALPALARAQATGQSAEVAVAAEPVLLSLVPPRVGPARLPDIDASLFWGAEPAGSPLPSPDDNEAVTVALLREVLRLRVRWLQELTARAAWQLAGRLAVAGALEDSGLARHLTLDELVQAVRTRHVPGSVAERVGSQRRSLPARFRLGADGSAVPAPSRTRGKAPAGDAVGAGGGRGGGIVHVGTATEDVPTGSVLVVSHLDPRLAPVIPRLAGLIAETGSPLSHLAILAREHNVPVVVGVTDATTRFVAGGHVQVDGDAGTVTVIDDGARLEPIGAAA